MKHKSEGDREAMETFDLESFEKATEIVARRLASFRLGLDVEDPYDYNDDEKLKAGIIVGSVLAQFSITPIDVRK